MKGKCPRCGGSGKEFYDRMICGTCSGKGEVNEDICKSCNHPKQRHLFEKSRDRLFCWEESSSGQFLCGCGGEKGFG